MYLIAKWADRGMWQFVELSFFALSWLSSGGRFTRSSKELLKSFRDWNNKKLFCRQPRLNTPISCWIATRRWRPATWSTTRSRPSAPRRRTREPRASTTTRTTMKGTSGILRRREKILRLTKHHRSVRILENRSEKQTHFLCFDNLEWIEKDNVCYLNYHNSDLNYKKKSLFTLLCQIKTK